MLDIKTIIANLKLEVEAEKDLISSVVTLVESLVTEIKNMANQGNLQAVVDITTEAHDQAQSIADVLKKYTASGQPTV